MNLALPCFSVSAKGHFTASSFFPGGSVCFYLQRFAAALPDLVSCMHLLCLPLALSGPSWGLHLKVVVFTELTFPMACGMFSSLMTTVGGLSSLLAVPCLGWHFLNCSSFFPNDISLFQVAHTIWQLLNIILGRNIYLWWKKLNVVRKTEPGRDNHQASVRVSAPTLYS